MSALEKRAIAVCFLFQFPHDGDTLEKPKVALFRRSGAVRTHQHKYSPISGSIDRDDSSPLATAWRELREETSLTETSLRVFRQGKPYTFSDEAAGREWRIHPFAFVLKTKNKTDSHASGDGIRLDWEHESYKWFHIDQVSDDDAFQGVPRLMESLRRVWFNLDLGDDAGDALSEGLCALRDDHESGARELAMQALDILRRVLQRLDTEDSAWWKNVRLVGWHLWKNGRESMGASILSVILAALAIIEDSLPAENDADIESLATTQERVAVALRAIEAFRHRREQANAKIGQQFAAWTSKHFPSSTAPDDTPLKILTLSSSSTVQAGLLYVARETARALDIRVLESRPLFEGASMATKLAASLPLAPRRKISIYTDASAAIAAKGIHVLLIGADLIDNCGNISNKTGSLPAVLAAKHVSSHVQVVVMSDKEKILPFEPPTHHEENDPHELTQSWETLGISQGDEGTLDVRNIYFEWVPHELIDEYIAEDGAYAAEDISRYAEQVAVKATLYFEDL